MNKLSIWQLIKLSRPRFWIYELWPYIIWVSSWLYIYMMKYGNIVLSASQIVSIIIMWLYFLIPANLYIYGINDIYDYETDKNNPKKQWYEILLTPDKHLYSWLCIVLASLPFLIFQLFLAKTVWIVFLLFLFFALFYSANPIRAKARPFLDMIFSSCLYVMPAIYWFVIINGGVDRINRIYILGGFCRCMAMQTYSAAPDITADQEAEIQTTATKLWYNNTLYLCILFYGLAGWLGFGQWNSLTSWTNWLWWIWVWVICIYIYFMIKSIIKPKDIFEYYKTFSILNLFVWFGIFLAICYHYYNFMITL